MKEIKIPVTEGQKRFEEIAAVILKILAELSEEERTQIFNFIVFTYNK